MSTYQMPEKFWVVTKVTLSQEALKYGTQALYPFHVEGTNLANETPVPFSWTVPDLDSHRFDLSNVTVPTVPPSPWSKSKKDAGLL